MRGEGGSLCPLTFPCRASDVRGAQQPHAHLHGHPALAGPRPRPGQRADPAAGLPRPQHRPLPRLGALRRRVSLPGRGGRASPGITGILSCPSASSSGRCRSQLAQGGGAAAVCPGGVGVAGGRGGGTKPLLVPGYLPAAPHLTSSPPSAAQGWAMGSCGVRAA